MGVIVKTNGDNFFNLIIYIKSYPKIIYIKFMFAIRWSIIGLEFYSAYQAWNAIFCVGYMPSYFVNFFVCLFLFM